MATATLQSFNVFLTDRLTAAAVDIYGFVEKTIVDYQEEVHRTKMENQRLQRLLDLIYKPEIRLHRADAKFPTASVYTQEDPPKQEWNPSEGQDEPGPSEVKEEEEVESKEEVWINGCREQTEEQAEDSDDGDALTKELIKTVQQLEDCRAAEESKEEEEEENPKHREKTSTTLYRCHICNYIFTKKNVLTWHLKTHESQGNFDCHICGKQIPCQSNLQNHMRVHTGERPYSCQFCGKCFKLKGHMTEHIRTHTGEKPFRCHICGKSFNRGSTLRKHVFAKHKEERPYKCEDCNELFTERLLLKKHLRKIHGIKLCTSQSTA
ncbi:zinc finger protein 771-like isoform X2 [Betta splendens]|uniref:Zinc finger protein 771-like isoform X2 n=1 Tax=Betta splendens TaxID=158456 RepID=A0A6P7MJ05_BETSP|nr:zinc finger protein 771-like isoform X2 [Betta splendens]